MAEHQGEACEIDIRRDTVMDLYLKGHTQREIAVQLGVSNGTVCNDIAAVRAEWRQDRIADYDDHREIRSKQICRVMVAAWNAWERSCLDAESVKVSVIKGKTNAAGNDLGDITRSEKTSKGQCGDPRFLEIYYRSVERLCHLYGLDAPKRTELTGPNGGPLTIATLLKVVADNPPPVPELESQPANVMDVESVLAQLENMSGEVVEVECHEPSENDG